MTKPTSFSLAVLIALGSACSKSDDKTAEGDGEGATESGETETETPQAKPADPKNAKPDPEIMSELKSVVEGCEINVSGVTVTKCKDKEEKKLIDKFQKGEIDRGEAIDTFVAALVGDDEEIKTVAANVSGNVFGRFGDSEVDPQAARRLVAAVGQLEKYHAAQSTLSAVHAATRAEVYDDLYKMLDTHSYPYVKQKGYEHVMINGRLDVFDKIKEVAESDEEKVAAAALAAPRRMPKPTEAEQAKVCPWARGYLSSDKPVVYKQAGHDMVWCGGEYIDALLDEGEKRLAEGHFDRDSYLVFRDVCFTPVKGAIKEAGKKEQCERTFKLLEDAVNNEKVKPRDRGLALFAIYYQRRDEESMKVMKKYKNSKVPEIKQRAEEAIKSLREHYNVK